MSAKLVPLILSGGIGARLWPVSCAAHPKQFMRLPDGEILLEKTLKRTVISISL
jgi:mannose-1-phosphate guanylyltransferase